MMHVFLRGTWHKSLTRHGRQTRACTWGWAQVRYASSLGLGGYYSSSFSRQIAEPPIGDRVVIFRGQPRGT